MYLRTRERPGLGLGQFPPAPDSPVANVFVQAHRSRWCVPGAGPPGSTCRHLVAPRPIRRVVIHTLTSAGAGECIRFDTVNDVVRAWQNPGVACSHYLVDRNGDITQMVREANVAFHATAANPDSIGIEHADICNEPAPYTTQLYERSAALVGEIAARNGFPIRVFGIDTNNRNDATVIGHQILDPANRDDPGPYWDWEYYASLLRWDPRTGTRPIRLVATIPPPPVAPVAVAPIPVAPQGWQVRSRVQVLGEPRTCIPNGFCANRNHSYSDHYWRAAPNTPGSDIVFQFPPLQAGRYKISLWWPNVQNANAETSVQARIDYVASTIVQDAVINQRRNSGQWNDIGAPFICSVPNGQDADVSVRIRRASGLAGWILGDAARILKVG
jgi:hypothetical protein